jgi:hypothetical protein
VQPEGWRAQWSRAAALQAYRVGTWQAGCSFIGLWHGEAFHDVRVYSAVFLALSGALPQAGVSPVSLQCPWFRISQGLQLCLSRHLEESRSLSFFSRVLVGNEPWRERDEGVWVSIDT